MNESEKNIYFFLEGFFFQAVKFLQWLIFEKENVIFFNTYLSFNLFYLIVVNFF